MIPYDDLVVALATWRAKQGLPGAALSGMPLSAAPTAFATPRAAPPPRGGLVPPPLASPDPHDDAVDVDEGALIEESHYENDGDDFAMAFDASKTSTSQVAVEQEATAIGMPPPPGARDSFGGATSLDPEPEPEPEDQPAPRRSEDW